MEFEQESGISGNVDKSTLQTALDYFNLFFTSEFVSELVNTTNINAAESRRISQARGTWEPVDIATMRVFIGVVLLRGIVDKPRIKDYWSRTAEIATPFFSSMLKRDRFTSILYGKSYQNPICNLP